MRIKLADDTETTITVAKGFSDKGGERSSELQNSKRYDMPKRALKRPRRRKSPIVIRIPVPRPGSNHGDRTKYNRKQKHKRKHNGES